MLPTPTKTSQEALYNRNVTIPPHEDQGGGTEHGIPEGGTKDQVLAKKSNADYDVEWQTIEGGGSGLPEGGTTGQALTKKSNTDGDVEWSNIRQLPSVGMVSGFRRYLSVPRESADPAWYVKNDIIKYDVRSIYTTNPFSGNGSMSITPQGITATLCRFMTPQGGNVIRLLSDNFQDAYFTFGSASAFRISATTRGNVNSAFDADALPVQESWHCIIRVYVATDPENPDPDTDRYLGGRTFNTPQRTVLMSNNESYIELNYDDTTSGNHGIPYRGDLGVDYWDLQELTEEEQAKVYITGQIDYRAKLDGVYPADITGALPSLSHSYNIAELDPDEQLGWFEILAIKPEQQTTWISD